MATQPIETTTEAPPPDIQSDPPERDYESEARQHGWRPKEEFKGDEARWTDAETFMKRADEVLPFIKKQNSALKTKVDILERMVKKVQKSEMAAYDNALAAIKAQMKDAVAVGDEAAFDALDAKAEKLRKDMAEDASPVDRSEGHARAVLLSFRKANPWYDRGEFATDGSEEKEAFIRTRQIFEEQVLAGLDKEAPEVFFEKAFAQANEEFPDLNKKPARTKPASDVAGVTRTNGRSNAKTGANLPTEAKEAVRRYMRQGIYKGKTFDEAANLFAADYDWSVS